MPGKHGGSYDPLQADGIKTAPLNVNLRLTTEELEVLDVACAVLQMTRRQVVTKMVRDGIRGYF